MEIWTALLIGFLGSFHCIGMCGPIALALPGGRTAFMLAGRLLYNAGRVATYCLLGGIFGTVGHSLALAGLQQALSLTLGVIIIAGILLRSRSYPRLKKALHVDRLFGRLKEAIRSRFEQRGLSSFLIVGILNGLLPCGFVYMGLAGSLTTGSVGGGMLYMTLFGLGTFPAMFALSMAPAMISFRWRARINRAIPYLAFTFGAYLIYRGVTFGGMH